MSSDHGSDILYGNSTVQALSKCFFPLKKIHPEGPVLKNGSAYGSSVSLSLYKNVIICVCTPKNIQYDVHMYIYIYMYTYRYLDYLEPVTIITLHLVTGPSRIDEMLTGVPNSVRILSREGQHAFKTQSRSFLSSWLIQALCRRAHIARTPERHPCISSCTSIMGQPSPQ